MTDILEWFAAIGAIAAAGLIAADLGRRITGWAFVLFCLVSIAWVAAGMLEGEQPLVIQNGILLIVNVWGAWQYLLSPKNRRKIERLKELEEQAEEDVEAGRA
jgi:uncharacterized membrane protein YphA (DoxX/SURF4 family)